MNVTHKKTLVSVTLNRDEVIQLLDKYGLTKEYVPTLPPWVGTRRPEDLHGVFYTLWKEVYGE